GATMPSTTRRRPGLTPAIFFRPKNTAVSTPRPSFTPTSRAGAPARGTIRTEEISPTTLATVRGSTSSIGQQPSSWEQNSTSFSRSCSSTGFVSLLTRFFSATPRGYRRPRCGRDRSAGEAGRRPRGGGPADAPRRRPRPSGPLRRSRAAAAPRGRRAARRPGRRPALRPPGRGRRPAPGRTQRGPGHGDGLGEVAVLPGADRRVGARRRQGHGPAAVPHQGPGPRPAPVAAVVAGPRDAGRDL